MLKSIHNFPIHKENLKRVLKGRIFESKCSIVEDGNLSALQTRRRRREEGKFFGFGKFLGTSNQTFSNPKSERHKVKELKSIQKKVF